jgi:hypothetical protein
LFLAWASPAGVDADRAFNEWYDQVHVPDVRRAIPSVSRVERYQIVTPAADAELAHRYLAVYEMDSEDIGAAAAALRAAIDAEHIVLGPELDRAVNPPRLEWYRHV